MSKPITHFVILGDKSGSMQKQRQQFIDGYNEQVQQLKLDAAEQELYCSLVTFNRDPQVHLWGKPAAELVEATLEDYNPSGGTAMRDAIAFVINELEKTTDTSDKNAAYCIYTISDGESFDDVKYSHQDAKKMEAFRNLIQQYESKGRWTFSFQGCSREYLYELSRQTGIAPSNMAMFAKDVGSYEHANKLARGRTQKYLKSRSEGKFAGANFMSDDAAVACFVPGEKTNVPTPSVTNKLLNDAINKATVKTARAEDLISPKGRVSPFSNTQKAEWAYRG